MCRAFRCVNVSGASGFRETSHYSPSFPSPSSSRSCDLWSCMLAWSFRWESEAFTCTDAISSCSGFTLSGLWASKAANTALLPTRRPRKLGAAVLSSSDALLLWLERSFQVSVWHHQQMTSFWEEKKLFLWKMQPSPFFLSFLLHVSAQKSNCESLTQAKCCCWSGTNHFIPEKL